MSTRHEVHEMFARRAAANRCPDPDANTAVFGSQVVLPVVFFGALLAWAAIAWAVV